jgi:hypothetical protein
LSSIFLKTLFYTLASTVSAIHNECIKIKTDNLQRDVNKNRIRKMLAEPAPPETICRC